MNSMGKEHVIFLSLPHLLIKEIKNKKSFFLPQAPISLRHNFCKESKTKRHRPPLLDRANICFQSMISRIIYLFFSPQKQQISNYFCEGLKTITAVWRYKLSVYTTTFTFPQIRCVSWSPDLRIIGSSDAQNTLQETKCGLLGQLRPALVATD